jgi:twinkle protein
MIVKPKDLIVEVTALYNGKLEKGVSTGWGELDEFFTVKESEFTVVTGMPSHGKSEWLDALAVNLVMNHNYRIAIFSPENYPLELHVAKIIEKLSEEKFFGSNRIKHDDMQMCLDVMQKHFAFVVPSENQFTPKDILSEAYPWLNQSGTQPKAMIIDPWNEMDHYRPNGLSETEYISRTLTELRRMSRDFKVHLFLVAHPKMMNKDKDGNYPVPRPYDISGSAHWYNKADNCIAIWRDVANNPELVEIHIQKVRFKTTGKPGKATLRYNSEMSRYEHPRDAFYSTRGA